MEGGSEPAHFVLTVPNFEPQKALSDDLKERLVTLDTMQSLLSSQAKIIEHEVRNIKQIGLSLQALSSIDFNDTFQVVLKKPVNNAD